MVVRRIDGCEQDQPVTSLDDELIELRREIHRHPELAGDERETAGLVAEQLRAAGLEVTTGVGVARALAQRPEAVRGRLAFVFQPAEEPLRGARAMLDTGLVQRLAPRECYALHCAPFPAGTIAVSPGYGLPGLDHIRIVLPGGDDAAVAAIASEVAKLNNVDFPQSLADYHARFHAVLEPEIAASIQESVSVAQWTEHTSDARPVANILLRVWPAGTWARRWGRSPSCGPGRPGPSTARISHCSSTRRRARCSTSASRTPRRG